MADAERNPTYLRDLAGHVAVFRGDFQSFLELHTPTYRGPGVGVLPAVMPLTDSDPAEIDVLRARVSEAAGRARRAPALTGCLIGVVNLNGQRNVVDPIAAWLTVMQPKPMLEPENIIDACNQMIGSLAELADRAEAELPPSVDVAEMHPAVWGQAARSWRDGHYRQAVSAAADGVIGLVKSRTGRRDIEDTSLLQQAFSKDDHEPGKPPAMAGEPDRQDRDLDEQRPRQFAPGAQLTIRNPATHGPGELTEQEAVERLSVLSLLARWVDQCDLIEAPVSSADEAEDG